VTRAGFWSHCVEPQARSVGYWCGGRISRTDSNLFGELPVTLGGVPVVESEAARMD
jgi:hypothetical protein